MNKMNSINALFHQRNMEFVKSLGYGSGCVILCGSGCWATFSTVMSGGFATFSDANKQFLTAREILRHIAFIIPIPITMGCYIYLISRMGTNSILHARKGLELHRKYVTSYYCK